jgi:uncharacterized protein YndB with AHSA1/START domain
MQEDQVQESDTTPEGADPCVWREITIEATPAEVWELLESEAGRRQWLEPDPERTIEVIESEPPSRLIWRWQVSDEREHRVEIIAVPEDDRTRVIVIESAPSVPLAMLAGAAADLHQSCLSRRWTLALA